MRTKPAGTFKTMAEDSAIFKTITNTEDVNKQFIDNSEDSRTRRRLSFSPENAANDPEKPNISCKVRTFKDVSEDSSSGRLCTEMAEQTSSPPRAEKSSLKVKNAKEMSDFSSEQRNNEKQTSVDTSNDKENTTNPSTTTTTDDSREENSSGERNPQDFSVTVGKQQTNKEDMDAEVVRRAQEEGLVNVVFSGTVTQEGCCRFVSEILKCILYQRQQLPMTYDQLVYSQKKQEASMQDKDSVNRRPAPSANTDWRKCQQTLQELEEVLQQLEGLFSLSRVPRVLLLMGGSLIVPKELYEINMEDLEVAAGEQSLRVSSCLRHLFRTLFVADLLSDSKPVRLLPTTVLVLAHRDCGVTWFRPKLQFKVPTRVKTRVIALSSNLRAEESDWQDYVWFQAPVTIKGIGKLA
ncbi:MAD2L1-binding protein [Xyrichtys novacula]|uniref:MAD2L1-binding protein n=1 Tax=Xyrichtys novacula TaxID=13765 RepID=A0AAV1G4B3_XYRNO|nr:MAD2L1-binding protein [Xyrichtys novacula]